MNGDQDLQGSLTLEGPLLEMAYSALCVSRGEDVVPRLETLGVYHDVFIRNSKGHVFVECDGQKTISMDKLELFRDEVLKLNSLLKSRDQLPITEARLVVMLPRKEWSPEVSAVLEDIKNVFNEEAIKLVLVEPKRLLYDLISNSILGFVLVDSHIVMVGPGHWAIRYNPSVSRFMYSESSIDLDRFRKLPQSFLARDYWNERHKEIYTQYAELSRESRPEWFNWKFPEIFGIVWKNREQLARSVVRAYSMTGGEVVYQDDNGFISLKRLKRGSYYTANIVYTGHIIDGDDATEIDRELLQMVQGFRESGAMEEDHEFYFRIFTDTITFSHLYWTKSKFNTHDGEVYYTEIHRGDDVLIETMNSGELGLKLTENSITLSMEQGSDTLTLVRGSLQWESSKEGTYPATLKF